MKRLFVVVVSLCLLVFISSCGSNENLGGAAGDFNTVQVSAEAVSIDVESDVATHSDINNCGVAGTDKITVPAAETVDIVVTSKSYTGKSTSIPLSDVQVTGATISYEAITDPDTHVVGPSLGTRIYPVSKTIPANGNDTVTIRVGFQEIKDFLFNSLVCVGPIYAYKATINLSVVEINSNLTKNIPVATIVRFADFTDK